ncbi:AMP-binding protein [Novosphingobium piscinae]|uniref:AMP-binding protein n=1 Tax=Novosphingobium piscinae TaxID=1507448 RepID=UPI0031B5E929
MRNVGHAAAGQGAGLHPVQAGRPCPDRQCRAARDDAQAASEQGATQSVDVTPADIAVIQYTGGTTGVPKGAMLMLRAMVRALSPAPPVWPSFSSRRRRVAHSLTTRNEPPNPASFSRRHN